MAWKPADPGYPPDVDPSEMVHQIIFLEEVSGVDASGVSITWAAGNPPDVTWAKIDEPRGRAAIRGGQEIAQIDAVVTIRYRPGLIANKRFQDSNGNVYVIQSNPKPKGMNMFLVLDCLILGNNV